MTTTSASGAVRARGLVISLSLALVAAAVWYVNLRSGPADFSGSGQSHFLRKANTLLDRFGPGDKVRDVADRLWHEGHRSESIELLRVAAGVSGDHPTEFIANTRLLGQFLSWSGDEVGSRQCFESVLSTLVGMTDFLGGEFVDAYSAAIHLAGPMAAEGRGEEVLSYLRFIRANPDKIHASWLRHVLYHEASTLIAMGRAAEAVDLMADHTAFLLAGSASERISIGLKAYTAFQIDPPQPRAADFIGAVWADPIARQDWRIGSLGMAWSRSLLKSGRRDEAMHAAIEVFRFLNDPANAPGVDESGEDPVMAGIIRRDRDGNWEAMLSMLQTAGQHGFPEYALEVNLAWAERLPAGSERHAMVMREVEKLARAVELQSREDGR